MPSGPRLTVHTATIHTATIEVRTLTLSAKQVTLSVFRQLQEQFVLELDRLNQPTRLLGEGWGWVNYCPGSAHCDWARQGLWPHRHLVWQLGEELRRCPLPLPGNSLHTAYSRIDGYAALDDLPQLFIAV